jgi:hypothetical protein
MSQKVVQYQAALQLAQTAPQLYNLPLLHRQMLDVLGIQNYQKLVPIEEDRKPEDPITENQNIIMMKPVKAFLYQDHQAHIQVHMSAMQDPKIQKLVGQNPMAQQLQAAMMAHINEHIAYEYRKQMEMAMGIELPPTKEEEEHGMPPEMEVRVSQMAAQASAQLLQRNQQEAQQQAIQQQLQDPLIQMQQQELAIKQAELQLKEKKLQIDAAAKTDQLDIEEERIRSQERIAGLQVGAKAAKDKEEITQKYQAEGLKIGAQIAKDRVEMTRAHAESQRTKQENPAK